MGQADKGGTGPDAVLFLDRIINRQITWAMIGLRWLPAEINAYLSSQAMLEIDHLAIHLFRNRLRPEDVSQTLALNAALAIGADWPKRSVIAPPRPERLCAFLDVPALWGVMTIRRIAVRRSALAPIDNAAPSVDRCANHGRVLEAALAALTGISNTQPVPTSKQLSSLWDRFERSVALAFGPLFLLPSITETHIPSVDGNPAIRVAYARA